MFHASLYTRDGQCVRSCPMFIKPKKKTKKKQIVTRRKLCRTSKRNVHYPDAIVYGFGVDNSQSVDKESKKKQTKIDKYLEFR